MNDVMEGNPLTAEQVNRDWELLHEHEKEWLIGVGARNRQAMCSSIRALVTAIYGWSERGDWAQFKRWIDHEADASLGR